MGCLTTLLLIVIWLNQQKISINSFLSHGEVTDTIEPTRYNLLLTVTVYYSIVGTPAPTLPPRDTPSLADHLTADHFQKTAYWSATRSWATHDARETQDYFKTQTALALTATPTPSPSKTLTATPTWTPTPTATPFPAIIPYPTGFPPVCPGGGGEWMWVDGELVFVCGVSWE